MKKTLSLSSATGPYPPPGLIFRPGTKVDLIFDLESETPLVRSSTIYEFEPVQRTIILGQTVPPTTGKGKTSSPFDVTTVLKYAGQSPVRVALRCSPPLVLPDYLLSGGNKVQALLANLADPLRIRNLNIRSSFRVNVNAIYDVHCRLVHDGQVYVSHQHLHVHDLSGTGMGLVIPKMLTDGPNELMKLTVSAKVKLTLLLRCREGCGFDDHVEIEGCVVRYHHDHSDKYAFMAIAFTGMNAADENRLGHFIHHAQLLLIRRERALDN